MIPTLSLKKPRRSEAIRSIATTSANTTTKQSTLSFKMNRQPIRVTHLTNNTSGTTQDQT